MKCFRVTAAAGVLIPLLTMGALAQTATPSPAAAPTIIASTVDMTTKVLDMDGKPVADNTQAKPKVIPEGWQPPDLTYGRVIVLVMCNDRPDNKDKAESAADKAIRCGLGMSLMNDKAASLTASQIGQIEDYLLLWPSNLVMTEIVRAIDPNAAHKSK